MKNALRALLVWAGLFPALTLVLTAADTASVLRVGVAPVSPPMVYKQGTNIVGLEVDFAQALGSELKREVKFVELPWEDLMDALVDDKIDIIMSSLSITRARQFRIAFSAPYLRVGQMALVRSDELQRYVLLTDSLSSRTLGVRKGTTGDLLAQQEFPRAKRKFYASDEEGAAALLKSKIDLFIDDSTMIWYLAGKYEAKGLAVAPLVFSEEFLGWGMRRTDTALQESVSAFLKKGQANGDLNRILYRWIPRFK